jgi:hypothetical protein
MMSVQKRREQAFGGDGSLYLWRKKVGMKKVGSGYIFRFG